MQLTKSDIESVIRASTILGTGGGGRLDNAQKLLTAINLEGLRLVPIVDLPSAGYVVTAYGIGGLTKSSVSQQVVRKRCQELLGERLDGPIIGVIPVEIGPGSLAQAIALATALDVPLVDGDLAGFRAVPEIFIELMTLAKLERCPMVI